MLCRCDCGNTTEVAISNLTRKVTSCGCRLREVNHSPAKGTHLQSYTPEHKVWDSMLQRCLNPASQCYASYGGRGITVCDRWLKFENFIQDMGKRPSANHSIERVCNNEGYNPDNCKWATRSEQARNRRSSRFIAHEGQTKTLIEWSEVLQVPYEALRQRLYRNGSFYTSK